MSGLNYLFQKWQYRGTAPTNTIVNATGPKTHDSDESVFGFQPACVCPNSCAKGDAPQMRMTDQETRHTPKRMLAGIGSSQIWTNSAQ